MTYDRLNDIPKKSECHDKALYLPYGAHAASIHPILNAFASAAISLRNKLIHGAALSNDVPTASQNCAGDKQVPMDLLADQLFYNAIKAQDIAWYASEEREQAIAVDPSGTYAVAIDPLDGSSNVNINMSVGSIFSIYPAERTAAQSFLRPPKHQIAAGYFIYGPQTWLMLTCGKGVLSYRYHPEAGAFTLVHSGVLITNYSREFAINMANYHHWTKPIRAYVDACIDPNQSDGQKSFNMRWIASLVAEAQRIFNRGGVFLYPSEQRPRYEEGRLRQVYECGPIAFLVEQAGGKATDGTRAIMEKTAEHLHARSPLIFGSSENVDSVLDYYERPDHELSALFTSRGLFREE